MRNPGRAVERLSKVRQVGVDVSRIWDRFLRDYPEALDVAKNYDGAEGNRPNMEVEMAWKGCLKQFFQTRMFADVVLKDKYEFESPLDPELWEAWLKASLDPEVHLVDWIRRGVPLGTNKEIPCCGIFPMADDPEHSWRNNWAWQIIRASRMSRNMPGQSLWRRALRWSSRRTRPTPRASTARCPSWRCW